MPRTSNTSPQTQTVLQALSRTHPAWTHGYDLSKVTDLKSGTLYPLLRRLHDQHLLDARWEDSPVPGRPQRHIYQLSESGLALAATLALSTPAAEPVRTRGKRRSALSSLFEFIVGWPSQGARA
jgi:PadR family transcriptional regulator, regulatory protein PadR